MPKFYDFDLDIQTIGVIDPQIRDDGPGSGPTVGTSATITATTITVNPPTNKCTAGFGCGAWDSIKKEHTVLTNS